MRNMVIAVCFLCVLCAAAAFAQTASVLSNNPQPTVVPEHVLHASQHAMADDQNLRGTSAYSYEHGSEPLWQFGSDKHETPLGDVARAYRKEHAIDRRAVIVFEK